MAAPSDLERRLFEAAVAGETLDLRAGVERELRAGVVRDVLLGEHGPVDARGLQVRGAALASARRVLVAQQEYLHRSLTGWTRLQHRLFGLTLQYGYQPVRAVALLAAVLAIGIGLFLGLSAGTSTPAGTECPAVDRIGLAVDVAIPLVSTGATDRCQLATGTGSGQALAAAGWLLTLLGWAAATLVVAGHSGWVRRR
jgi:hypothetical protein